MVGPVSSAVKRGMQHLPELVKFNLVVSVLLLYIRVRGFLIIWLADRRGIK